MLKTIDKIASHIACVSVFLIPFFTYAFLNVQTRADTITIALELPQPKPVTKIYEFGPDEDFPSGYIRPAYTDYDKQFIADVKQRPLKRPYTKNDILCMAKNIYFEARTQSLKGQLAVGLVTLNRVKSPYFPNNICDVVYQHLQFSWFWDGLSDRPKYPRQWTTALLLASSLLFEDARIYDFTYGSDHYHATYVAPQWRLAMVKVVQIEEHIFYRYYENKTL